MGIDIVNFYSSYGSYHNNIINKAIHLVCIPLILLSAIQIVNHYSFSIDTGCCKLNFGLIILFVLALVYMAVDLLSGILASSFYITITILMNQHFANADENLWSHHLCVATTFQITCWILQFIGHGVFEKHLPFQTIFYKYLLLQTLYSWKYCSFLVINHRSIRLARIKQKKISNNSGIKRNLDDIILKKQIQSMIGKEQVDVIDQYAQSIVNYVDNQQKIIQLKTSTIQKLNEVTIVHYQKNLDKINQIRSEFEETKSICKQLIFL
ncbi:unnamed protein product [Paramecium sonneborni]|uniref:Transmembrane protein n=1 Tax=Paramecium sonneborni TaxID=65129 RepID=A0A8S1R9R5_9CILI|nr:unnamed protein product [Paramecium sonneborni]